MSSLKIPNLFTFLRKHSVKVKPLVIADENVLNSINNNTFKPKKHPGIMTPKTVLIPDTLIKAVVNAIEDYPVKALLVNSEKLARHLKGRVPPMEQEDIKQITKKVHERVVHKFKDTVINNEDEEKRFKQMVQDKVSNILREKIYNWKPIKYDTYNSLLYLMTRSAAEYAVLVKLFGEIFSRDPEFQPRSLFDFGSGVGMATWAANMYWKKHVFEYFNVDASRDMNDLAEILLKSGKGSGRMSLKGVFYRQFLPATKTTYDLVISAFTLLELPSMESRLQTMLNLWNKTGKYLVIVEQGTNAGFKVVNEAKDFILQIKKDSNMGHVFSPCPHNDLCPRFLSDDGTPCNFEVTHFTLPIGQPSETKKELYSYVILKRGKRDENDPQWPRIVRPALVRSKHTICRVCTSNGKLDEVIFTAAKHGKCLYFWQFSLCWYKPIGILTPKQTLFQLNKEKELVESGKVIYNGKHTGSKNGKSKKYLSQCGERYGVLWTPGNGYLFQNHP